MTFRSRRGLFAVFAIVLLAAMATPAVASADDAGEDRTTSLRDLMKPPRGYMRIVGSLDLGKGMRFNNPYRLRTELGSTAESVALTATYVDLGAGIAFGAPNGLEHGAALHLSFSVAGVPQEILVPSYFAALPIGRRALAYARLGPAIILSPDFNVGAELAAAFSFFLTAKIAAHGEVLGDLFYGAATLDKKFTVYPIVSAQLGVLVQQEILP